MHSGGEVKSYRALVFSAREQRKEKRDADRPRKDGGQMTDVTVLSS